MATQDKKEVVVLPCETDGLLNDWFVYQHPQKDIGSPIYHHPYPTHQSFMHQPAETTHTTPSKSNVSRLLLLLALLVTFMLYSMIYLLVLTPSHSFTHLSDAPKQTQNAWRSDTSLNVKLPCGPDTSLPCPVPMMPEKTIPHFDHWTSNQNVSNFMNGSWNMQFMRLVLFQSHFRFKRNQTRPSMHLLISAFPLEIMFLSLLY